MDIKRELGNALLRVRIAKGLTQEDFSVVSSRTYISSLERGNKSATMKKVEEISGKMNVHPLVPLLMAYSAKERISVEKLAKRVLAEIAEVEEASAVADAQLKPGKSIGRKRTRKARGA